MQSEWAGSEQNDTAVLIVGAGPTGLTLACDLARRGVTCRIIDKTPEHFSGSRGKGLQPRTLEVFDDLGVIEPILRAGAAYPRLRLHFGRLHLHWTMFKQRAASASVPYPNTWMVPQWRTEEILRSRLAEHGGRVELATELTVFAQDEYGVTASLSRQGELEQVRASYLVGADGGRSSVRKQLGVGFAGKTYESERMLVGDVRVDGLERSHWHIWPRARGGAVALCPLPGTDRFQLTAQLPANVAAPEFTAEAIQSFVAAAVGSETLRISDPSWLSIYRPNVRMVERYRVGRVFLAGDAAHVHPPAGGQGLNTGVQDAYNLGWKLAQALEGAPDSLLDTYEQERLPVAAGVLGLSTKLYQQASRGSLRPQRRGAQTQQLGLGYRDSPLSRDSRSRPGQLRAGDRAPDGVCSDGGAEVRLFDLLRGPHFTLLAFGAGHGAAIAAINERYGARVRAYAVVSSSQPDDRAAIVDPAGHLARAYAGARLALIRPDGYLGLVSDRCDPHEVCGYLEAAVGGRQSVAGGR
jgi:2-polyprenyl-6-methoxyphenol hydroxylase-like FAD-dependent oxidoreductase